MMQYTFTQSSFVTIYSRDIIRTMFNSVTITEVVSSVLLAAITMAAGIILAAVSLLRKKRFSFWTICGIFILGIGLCMFLIWG